MKKFYIVTAILFLIAGIAYVRLAIKLSHTVENEIGYKNAFSNNCGAVFTLGCDTIAVYTHGDYVLIKDLTKDTTLHILATDLNKHYKYYCIIFNSSRQSKETGIKLK